MWRCSARRASSFRWHFSPGSQEVAYRHAETIGQQVCQAHDHDDAGFESRPSRTGHYRKSRNRSIDRSVDEIPQIADLRRLGQPEPHSLRGVLPLEIGVGTSSTVKRTADHLAKIDQCFRRFTPPYPPARIPDDQKQESVLPGQSPSTTKTPWREGSRCRPEGHGGGPLRTCDLRVVRSGRGRKEAPTRRLRLRH